MVPGSMSVQEGHHDLEDLGLFLASLLALRGDVMRSLIVAAVVRRSLYIMAEFPNKCRALRRPP